MDLSSLKNFPALKNLTGRLFPDRCMKEIEEYRRLARESPDDMRVRQRIAELCYRSGKPDDAVAALWEIAEHFEKSDFVLKAIDTYKNILKIKPTLVEVNLKLAALFLKVDMRIEAGNQLRIAINHFARLHETDKTLALAKQLVDTDPSNENRAKLAEIYLGSGMADEAVAQYEVLAKDARLRKNYDRLLHFYEMILPHRPDNKAIIRDVCILHLRKKRPERALVLIDQYKTGNDPSFGDLAQKARLMMEAMKRQKK